MTLTDIERQAITIWTLIYNVQRKYHYSIPKTAIRTVRKACKKFMKNLEGTKYDTTDRFGTRWIDRIRIHVDNKEDLESTYLTWIQFQFHEFIHVFCPRSDPQDIHSRQPYYNKMLEVLTR